MNTAPSLTPKRLVHWFPEGFAWPAEDDRFGRYVMYPTRYDRPVGLGVVNDFGDLVPVPSTGIMTPQPITGVLA